MTVAAPPGAGTEPGLQAGLPPFSRVRLRQPAQRTTPSGAPRRAFPLKMRLQGGWGRQAAARRDDRRLARLAARLGEPRRHFPGGEPRRQFPARGEAARGEAARRHQALREYRGEGPLVGLAQHLLPLLLLLLVERLD